MLGCTKTLVCPHCATQVPAHASVCVGCGAEIVHGATRQERSTVGCLFTVVVMLVTMAIVALPLLANATSGVD